MMSVRTLTVEGWPDALARRLAWGFRCGAVHLAPASSREPSYRGNTALRPN
jgi:hypothetical protein